MSAIRLPEGVVLLERGWLSSNNVVFTIGRTAVVDTGYGTHAAQTVMLVEQVLQGRAPDLIVNTHLHSDHCGGNAALQAAFPAARTLIPPGSADAVARWDAKELTFEATGQSCVRFAFDGLLRPGESIELGTAGWEVHAAPGHDPHSVVLFEPSSRTLVSADALWQNGFGVVFPELDGELAFGAVAATLDLIERLAPAVVIPGHGGTFGGAEVPAALARARSRLASFVADPRRHASHAMKVLIKFKLLEWQQVSLPEFLEWAHSMPYLNRVHARFAGQTPLGDWLESLLGDLERAGALERDAAMLRNL